MLISQTLMEMTAMGAYIISLLSHWPEWYKKKKSSKPSLANDKRPVPMLRHVQTTELLQMWLVNSNMAGVSA